MNQLSCQYFPMDRLAIFLWHFLISSICNNERSSKMLKKVLLWILPLMLFISMNAHAYVWINEHFQCKVYLNKSDEPVSFHEVEKISTSYLNFGFHNSFIKHSPSLSEEEKMYVVSHTENGHPYLMSVYTPEALSPSDHRAISTFLGKTQHENNRLTRWVRPAHPQRSEFVGGALYLARNYDPEDLINILPALGANNGEPFTAEQLELLTVDLNPVPFQGKSSGLPTSLVRRVPHVVPVDKETGKISFNFSARNAMCLQIHYPFNEYDGQSFHMCYSCSLSDAFETNNSRP